MKLLWCYFEGKDMYLEYILGVSFNGGLSDEVDFFYEFVGYCVVVDWFVLVMDY